MADARSEIGKALEGKLSPEQLSFLMDEVLAITKRPWADVTCRSCKQKQRVQVDVPDAKAVTGALIDLANQAWGRPDVAAGGDEEKITFIREVRK